MKSVETAVMVCYFWCRSTLRGVSGDQPRNTLGGGQRPLLTNKPLVVK